MRKLKFSILGLGDIGKVHQDAILMNPNASLVSIIDIQERNIESDIIYYASLEEFIQKDKETDVVIIASPNGIHYEQSIRCLKAGKNVLIEKPISLKTEEAQKIITVANEEKLRAFSCMQLRFSPVVKYIKELIDKNQLGEIYMVNIQCYWNRNKNYYQSREWSGDLEMDGGVLFTQFSHFIDIMNFWFKEVNCMSSRFYNFNHQNITDFPDSGKIDFEADGISGNFIFTTSTFLKNYESSITIIAEKGTIEIGNQYLNELKHIDLEDSSLLKDVSSQRKNFHAEAIQEVIEAIGFDRKSPLDAFHAINLVRFIEDAKSKKLK